MRSYLLPSILFITDIVTIVIVAFISLFIRFDGHIEPQYINQMVDALPLLLISYMLMFLIMHLYTRIWRYAGMREVLAVFVATTIVRLYSIPLCLYLVSHYHVLSILLHGSSLQVL